MRTKISTSNLSEKIKMLEKNGKKNIQENANLNGDIGELKRKGNFKYLIILKEIAKMMKSKI